VGYDSDLLDDQPHIVGSTGHRLYVDGDDARGQELVRSGGSLSAGSSRLWMAALALDDWDVVVDVGVNYGEMLLSADVPVGARRIGFEPNPRVLPYLRQSIEESGLEVDLREVALGAAEAEASFVVDTEWSGRSGLAGSHRTDEEHVLDHVVVPVRTLDAELALSDGDSVCVKIDVEGAEFDVLAGARDLMSDERGWAVMLEILHMDAFEQARLASEFRMRVLDRRTGDLVVVPPASPQRVSELISSGWVHAQDAVLTSRASAA
jgi:FkbM family methyltransferase